MTRQREALLSLEGSVRSGATEQMLRDVGEINGGVKTQVVHLTQRVYGQRAMQDSW